MNTPLGDALGASQAKRSSDRSGAPDTRLRGRRLILARVVWVAAVSLIVVPVLTRLPAYSTALQTVCTAATCGFTPDSAQALQKLGFSVLDALASPLLGCSGIALFHVPYSL
jgi:hypothetical protein